jgi:glycosyltransferase involved in cell wall biosynthesis
MSYIKCPLVTVVIPTYNSERTIERAIISVLTQEGIENLFKVEILICDDCSTDATRDLCGEYPVTFLRNLKHTGGPNHGRNHGILRAQGDLIAFLDHDDEWLPFKLKEQINEINKGYEFIYSFYVKRLEYVG